MKRVRTPPAIYLYCVVESTTEPSLDGVPAGLPETSPPRLLPLDGDLWLVVGDAPLPAFSAAEIERRLADLAWVSACAVAHERVVAHFATLAPVVPMKLFTLYESEARAVADLEGRREQIEAVLDRVAGCAEWGVRVHFDGSRPARGSKSAAPPADSGRSFLLRKKAEQADARNRVQHAAAAAEEAFADLDRQASASRRREPGAPAEPGPRLLLDAAFLVPSTAADAFERAVQAVAERLSGSACRLTLTGPWPPYNFIEEVG